MGVENLESLFKPTSVAVIGASDDPRSAGALAMRNLAGSAFLGPVLPISETQETVGGVQAYRDVDVLPLTPDLAILATEPEETLDYLRKLGARGVRAAILLPTSAARLAEDELEAWKKRVQEVIRPFGTRLLGPSSLGLINSAVGLNASLSHAPVKQGRLAFVSQSNALFSTVVDWSRSRGIGFSHVVSLGERFDIGFSDLLDYLSGDPATRSILLYVETVCDARNFLSAARAAARNKPILVIKPKRPGERPGPAADGGRDPQDDVYDAAFRRAGMLRVSDLDALFDAVETLTRMPPVKGDRLAILSNGAAPGYLAADALLGGGGRLAVLSEECEQGLCDIFGQPGAGLWKGRNPIAVAYDAPAAKYGEAVRQLARDKGVDAILALRSPTASVSGEEAAKAIIDAAKTFRKPVSASWLGAEDAAAARRLFAEAGIPAYDTPDKAIRAFQHMVDFRKSQGLLMETPASLPTDFQPDQARALFTVQQALAQGRTRLSEPEAMDALGAYGLEVAATRIAASAEMAPLIAGEIGYPVALKLLSDAVVGHKSDVGGVALDLESDEEVLAAARSMQMRLRKLRPGARPQGFAVQKMVRRPGAVELFVAASYDPVFGPVVRFGHGGYAADVIDDHAAALPPLNMSLARELVSRTRVSRLLRGYREQPPADMEALGLAIVQTAQLLLDTPQIAEIVVNPLLADQRGALALDARIELSADAQTAEPAIRPYPRELIENVTLKDGREAVLRPILPEDEPAHYEFFSKLTPEDIRFRFFGVLRDLSHQEMTRLTQIDYDREMAFVAQAKSPETGRPETLGVVRAMTKPDNESAEFAIMIRSDLKGLGLGTMLMAKMIRYLKARGLKLLTGQALPDNMGMQGLARKMGFALRKDYEDEVVEMNLALN